MRRVIFGSEKEWQRTLSVTIGALVMLGLLSRVISATPQVEQEITSGDSQLEAVRVIEVRSTNAPQAPAGTVIIVEVTSNGCTKKDDFVVKVVQGSTNQEMGIIRTRRDSCKRMSFPKTIELVTQDVVPGKPLIIKNPITVRLYSGSGKKSGQ
jgi:hypothetical protein